MHSLYSSRYFITVFLVFIALFWCIQDKTPLRYDDFDFLTTYKKDNDGTWKATNNIIQSTDEIIDTCCAHRNIKNGRTADILAILTINGFGKDGFTIFNTLVASLFALLYMRLCRLSYDVFRLVIFLSTALLILPSPFVTIFWRPGACNYLWGAVLFGVFLKIYENQRSFRYSHKKQYLCCISPWGTRGTYIGDADSRLRGEKVCIQKVHRRKLIGNPFFCARFYNCYISSALLVQSWKRNCSTLF